MLPERRTGATPADKDWLQVFKDSVPSGKARVLQDA